MQFALGDPIPDTDHAVSVSLPTWDANVGYEEGEDWVVGQMKTGYPRFFIHRTIQALAAEITAAHGREGFRALLFPTLASAESCRQFIRDRSPSLDPQSLEILHLGLDSSRPVAAAAAEHIQDLRPSIAAVLFPPDVFPVAKQFWQHTGEGVSSRRAQFYLELFQQGLLSVIPPTSSSSSSSPPTASSPPDLYSKTSRAPKRYQRSAPPSDPDPKKPSTPTAHGPGREAENLTREGDCFLEERYGRNLELSLAHQAKSALRRRIAAASTPVAIDDNAGAKAPDRDAVSPSEHDVFLFQGGMNAIYHAHRLLLATRPPAKSIEFGFPYVDTLKILEKFGPGCLFYGHGSDEELDDLAGRLARGERYLALFCEFPGNPLLSSPDLVRIRALADQYDFAVVIDETIGTFANVHVLPYADIVVSSLTKIFSGDCNVMGGSAILNPRSRYYASFRQKLRDDEAFFEDNYWREDAIFMERNSRDYQSRVDRINTNALAICQLLAASPLVKQVYYPLLLPTRPNYDHVRQPNGGYGGLFSVTFHRKAQAVAFYDRLQTAKGPSLGTNFTLVSPYAILAHYLELDWAAEFGVDRNLVRVSVGLEETESILATFRQGLEAAESQ